MFLARWLAIQSSHWAWKGIGAHNRELIFWVLPRGLITVVLAIRVAQARGVELEFVPGLAFAVILVTNALLVLASFRARRAAAAIPAAGPDTSAVATTTAEALPEPAHSRRWILNAGLLFFLAVGAFMLWYGNRAGHLRPAELVRWVQTHVHRGQ